MNNRQAGRRRGRGGQRSNGGNPNQGNGSRIDNRARGNAAQLLEKYKNLARDAQMQGDRVNTEYYLQFADHYFRVLNENRSRFEEQNRRQREEAGDDDGYDDEENAFDAEDGGDEGQPAAQPSAAQRAERFEPRPGTEADGPQGQDRGRGRRPRRPREDHVAAPREEQPDDAGESAGIDAALLPPAISVAPLAAEAGDEDAPKPRRRGRKPRAEAGDESVTAA